MRASVQRPEALGRLVDAHLPAAGLHRVELLFVPAPLEWGGTRSYPGLQFLGINAPLSEAPGDVVSLVFAVADLDGTRYLYWSVLATGRSGLAALASAPPEGQELASRWFSTYVGERTAWASARGAVRPAVPAAEELGRGAPTEPAAIRLLVP